MSRTFTDKGVEFHTFDGDKKSCNRCDGNLLAEQHRCASCNELFDYNQSFNAGGNWCTDCTGEA